MHVALWDRVAFWTGHFGCSRIMCASVVINDYAHFQGLHIWHGECIYNLA